MIKGGAVMKIKGIMITMAVILSLPALVHAQDKDWGQNTKTFNQEQRIAKQDLMKDPVKPTKEEKKLFSQARKTAKVAFRDRGRVPVGDGGVFLD